MLFFFFKFITSLFYYYAGCVALRIKKNIDPFTAATKCNAIHLLDTDRMCCW